MTTDWQYMAVWEKNGRFYICHAIDGDECVGPFKTFEDARVALESLKTWHTLRGTVGQWLVGP